MHFLRTTGAGGRYGLDVDAMLADTDPEQFDEWVALYRLEPWGDDWVQAARIIAAVMNAGGADPQIDPADLVPTSENTKRTDEVDDGSLVNVWKARLGC